MKKLLSIIMIFTILLSLQYESISYAESSPDSKDQPTIPSED